MTVFETLMFAVAFSSLIVAVLSFNQKNKSTLELAIHLGWIILL
ncbi:putative holin-like toxin [Virgibacillus dokdonensis]|nr:putative holin-like toxin [Virgibacillus dokdonensis]